MGIGIFILLYTEPLAFVRIQRTMSKTEKSFNTYRNILHFTSGATIAWMKEEGMIKNLPDCLKDYPEDGNPVVAVYHFK